jgi:hypothetical protein
MATSVTIEVLRQHLEDFGWSRYRVTPEPGEREGLIFTGYIGDVDRSPHTVIIDPMVEKGVLRIFSPDVVTAPPDSTAADRLHELVYTVAALNSRSVLAAFAYDPNDGEVSVAVSMPIEENDISFEQFKRALEAVIWGISTYGKGLQDIIDGKAKAQDVLKASAITPSPGELQALQRLLAELEARLHGKSDDKKDEDEEPSDDE